MKDCKPSFPRLLSGGVITFTLLLRAAIGQSTAPSGTYGFVANAYQIDSSGQNGGALVGLMNFDGAGNVSGTFTIKPRNPNRNNTFAIRSDSFTGTYSSNPDGTISAKLAFFFGPVTFDMVATNGGQGLQFVSTDTYGGTSSQIRGSSLQSLGGGLPIKLFFPSANGSIPVSLRGVTAAAAGLPTVVYTAAPATGSGAAQCPDGSTGTWTASLPSFTIVTFGSGFFTGNFLAAVIATVCGGTQVATQSGLVVGTVDMAGAINLGLQGSGYVISGTARVAQAGGSLNGSYGVQLNYSPFPWGTVGVMQFDGAGNVTASTHEGSLGANGTTTYTGTSSLNPDGTGAINLKFRDGQIAYERIATGGEPSGPTFSFVMTDGGSQLLLLRTDGNATFDSVFGTAQLQ